MTPRAPAAGSLNQRVRLEQSSPTEDSWGQRTGGFATVATVWANVRMQTGAETIRADAVTSAVKASIRIRYREDVTSGWRAAHLGAGGAVRATYDVQAVIPDPDRQFVDLVCQEVK